jgi:restriction system protein
MDSEKIMWGIHMPIEFENIALSKTPEIAISWHELGDLSSFKTQESIQKRYLEVYPEASSQSALVNSWQLFHYVVDMKIGDYVLFPSKSQHKIYIGEIVGDYRFDPSELKLANKRSVKWIKISPRTAFSQGALCESGSFHTVFQIKKYKDEFLKIANLTAEEERLKTNEPTESDETVASTAEDIERSTEDFIVKELARVYKGYPLQEVVKDLLEAMGYNAKMGPKGTDGGIDLIAYKDEFPPRIVVQVKSYDGKNAGLDEIKNLFATLQGGDVGIFVTLGDYSQQALDFLKSKPNIRALTGYDFVGLILKYYEGMPNDFQAKIPLKRVYIPTISEN